MGIKCDEFLQVPFQDGGRYTISVLVSQTRCFASAKQAQAQIPYACINVKTIGETQKGPVAIMTRFEILLRLSGLENFSGASKNGIMFYCSHAQALFTLKIFGLASHV